MAWKIRKRVDTVGNLVDWEFVMGGLSTAPARTMWNRLMQRTSKDQLARVDRTGVDAMVVWKGLRALAGHGLIRPIVEDKWDVVYVNPRAVHPFWLQGAALSDRIYAFEAGQWAPSRLMNPTLEMQTQERPHYEVKP